MWFGFKLGNVVNTLTCCHVTVLTWSSCFSLNFGCYPSLNLNDIVSVNVPWPTIELILVLLFYILTNNADLSPNETMWICTPRLKLFVVWKAHVASCWVCVFLFSLEYKFISTAIKFASLNLLNVWLCGLHTLKNCEPQGVPWHGMFLPYEFIFLHLLLLNYFISMETNYWTNTGFLRCCILWQIEFLLIKHGV
jgi:hypothetical protein